MIRLTRYLFVVSVLVAAACDHQPVDETDLNVGGHTAALSIATAVDEHSDVAGVRFSISPCDDPAAAVVEDRPLEDQLLPGNLIEFSNNPLDEFSGHLFSDLFTTLQPGCYDVTAIPITEDGAASEQCTPAEKQGVSIVDGETREVFLMIQCAMQGKGAIDAIAAINHEPTIDDVVFDDSKFVCGSTSEPICIVGSDVDDDPLEMYLRVQDEGCTVEPANQVTVDVIGEAQAACFLLTCSDQGRVDLTALIYDLVWREGSLVRVEEWLADEGYPGDSHGALSFFAYFDGRKFYPDNDGDGFGDENATPVLVCDGDSPPNGYVEDNTDCNDDNDQTYPGAPELCDGEDNDCDGDIDEDYNVGDDCDSGQLGECLTTGHYVCRDDGLGTVCDAVPGTPTDEICDGLDNDCDGDTDENLEYTMTVFADRGDGACCNPPPDICQNQTAVSGESFVVSSPNAERVCLNIRTTVNGQIGGCYDMDPTEIQEYEQLDFYFERSNGQRTHIGRSDDCNGSAETCQFCGPYEFCANLTQGTYRVVAQHIVAGSGCQSAGLRRGSITVTCR